MVHIDGLLNRAVDTRAVNTYCERIYYAILTDNDDLLKELQGEVKINTDDFRAAVWSSLSAAVRCKLRDVCPELT